MADHHTPVTVDKDAAENAYRGWNEFTKFTKYGIYFVVALLTLMAFTLL